MITKEEIISLDHLDTKCSVCGGYRRYIIIRNYEHDKLVSEEHKKVVETKNCKTCEKWLEED